MIVAQKKQLVVKVVNYHIMAGNLYKLGANGILRQRVLDYESPMILSEAHKGIAGGHYVGKETGQNILCAGLWWPTLHKDAKEFFQDVMFFKGLEIHLEGMRCHCIHKLHYRILRNGQ
jgi:hypothetical protein